MKPSLLIDSPNSPKVQHLCFPSPSNYLDRIPSSASSQKSQKSISKSPCKPKSQEQQVLDILVLQQNRDEVKQYIKNILDDLARFKNQNRKLKQQIDLHNQIQKSYHFELNQYKQQIHNLEEELIKYKNPVTKK